ncbi:hypothetical protein VNO77_30527 [Canavalia gladiata]|uniref:NmrA-like domain-containing protein n=1 Tax=Canavalia gladiata TaxID=3824 RepID=A0AAN9KNI3_CANGL
MVYGDLSDHESFVKAIKEVDVVISSVGGAQIDNQVKIIAEIKAGNIKRFLPSEFGLDVDRHHAGDCTNFEIDPSFGVEASQLYPEVKYTTVDNYLNAFV